MFVHVFVRVVFVYVCPCVVCAHGRVCVWSTVCSPVSQTACEVVHVVSVEVYSFRLFSCDHLFSHFIGSLEGTHQQQVCMFVQ